MEYKFEYKGKKFVSVPESSKVCEGCVLSSESSISDSVCYEANEYICCTEKKIIWLEDKSLVIQHEKGYKLDNNKLQYSLIPPLALEAVAKNLTAGLSKYPRDNWKKVENSEQRYLDALYRHLEAHRKGEVFDSESSVDKMPHLAAVAVNAMFLLEFLLNPELETNKEK